MHPWLQIGEYLVQWYYVLMCVGMVCGAVLSLYLAKAAKLNLNLFSLLILLGCVVGYLGARIFYVFTRVSVLNSTFNEMLTAANGLVWYGGLILSVLFAIIFLYVTRQPVWKTLDCIVPGIALGQIFGRLGCFMAGCCYGHPTNSWAGIVFPFISRDEFFNTPIHPTQLYEAFGSLCILYILLRSFYKKKYNGQVFLLYVLLYSVMRFFIEYFRGDNRGYILTQTLSTSQTISAFLAGVAVSFWLIRLFFFSTAQECTNDNIY